MPGDTGSSAAEPQLNLQALANESKRSALVTAFGKISPSHAEAATQAVVEAGVVPDATPTPEVPVVTSDPVVAPEPFVAQPEAVAESSSIEKSWQAVQQLLAQKNLGSQFILTKTGIQLDIYDGAQRLDQTQLEATLKLRDPENWQTIKNQLGQFIGQASQEFYVNPDGLKVIAASNEKLTPPVEKLPAAPVEKKPGLFTGLYRKAAEASKGLMNWLTSKDLQPEAQAALAQPEIAAQVQVVAERGQVRIMERVLNFLGLDKESRDQRRAKAETIKQENFDRENVRRILERQNGLNLAELRSGRDMLHYWQKLSRTEQRIDEALNLQSDYERAILILTQDTHGITEEIGRETALIQELVGQPDDHIIEASDFKRRNRLISERQRLNDQLTIIQRKLEIAKKAEEDARLQNAKHIAQRAPLTLKSDFVDADAVSPVIVAPAPLESTGVSVGNA